MTAPIDGSTGRLREPLPRPLRRILFGASIDGDCESTLPYQIQIDRAWALMLDARGLVARADVIEFLRALHELEATDFRILRGHEPIRGAFLLYEQTLASEMGTRLAADLQRARSRNDLNATLVRLRMRRPVTRLCVQLLRLAGAMRRLSSRTGDFVFPIYTHGQQALAGSVGHYFAAVTEEILFDARSLWDCWGDLQTSPLGAGAVCGTSVPIDAQFVAVLLGFDATAVNSLRAVASRRVVLEVLSATAMLSVTLSRVAGDVMAWCTDELRFARLPDRLVGSSSHLPQKRNLFLLEHAQSRASSAQGAFVAAVAAMNSKSFTNSVAVGTEAVRPMWSALVDAADAVVVLRTLLDGIEFDRDEMTRRVCVGATSAADLTELLVQRGSTFRQAHHAVGELVSRAERDGIPFADAAVDAATAAGIPDARGQLEPAAAVRRREYGGGTGPASLANQGDAHRQSIHLLRDRLRSVRHRHRDAACLLRKGVSEIARLSPTSNSPSPRKEDS